METQVIDIPRKEVRRSSMTLAAAFEGDAVFDYCFGDAGAYGRLAPAMFAGYIRWARLYGRAWASQDLRVVALRLPPGGQSFSTWNTLRSGMIFPFLFLERDAKERFGRLGELVTKVRRRVMGKTPHWYCWMIGVLPSHQGKGIGGRMMRHTFARAAMSRAPCYLETFSEGNVEVHSSQGYEVREAVRFEGTPLTLYAMVRGAQ